MSSALLLANHSSIQDFHLHIFPLFFSDTPLHSRIILHLPQTESYPTNNIDSETITAPVRFIHINHPQ
jgi:hypothetical protein